MVVVYFFYGLAFFSLGLAIAIYPKRKDSSWFARNILFIAAFGFSHGANEWVDMFQLIQPSPILEVFAISLSGISFFCLAWFGVASLVDRGAPRVFHVLLVIISITPIILTLQFNLSKSTTSAVVKYIIGLPGTVLTAVALWMRSGDNGDRFSQRLLKLSAIAFGLYGLTSIIIGPEAPFIPASILNLNAFLTLTGVPIQLIRAAIAIVVASLMTTTLRTFDVSERELSIRESETRYRDLFENANDAIFIVDADLKYQDVNKRAVEIFGYSREEFLTMHITDILPEEQLPASQEEFDKISEQKSYERFVGRAKTKDGHMINIEVSSSPIIKNSKVIGSRDVVRDITHRTRLEQQLLQAQKMEAVGQLAGGVAHDFNNILTAILGYAELIRIEIQQDSKTNEWLVSIIDAVKNAAGLTKNLLAFSRKQVMRMRPIDLNEVVHASKQLLAGSIGEDVELDFREGSENIGVLGDENQLIQVVLNLANNARDAMPNGGSLSITTDRSQTDFPLDMRETVLPPGAYAVLSVTDNGHGMDNETLGKIFEPFYTTKEVGKGSGLGLSTVYGIVKQHNGAIRANSEPGSGTVMQVYLPLRDDQSQVVSKAKNLPHSNRGNESILLAEDDDLVRRLIERVLTEAGYVVIVASDGMDAVQKFALFSKDIELAILDVIMPKLNGQEVYDEIRRMKQSIKAVFVTGYAADLVKLKGLTEDSMKDGDPKIVNKPIGTEELLSTVREILDEI